MPRHKVPTLQTWKWALAIRRHDPVRMLQLRASIQSEPMITRVLLALLGYLLLVAWAFVALRLGLALFPEFMTRPFRSAAQMLVLLGFATISLILCFGASAVGIAWLTRRYRLISDESLEYLLRKGPF